MPITVTLEDLLGTYSESAFQTTQLSVLSALGLQTTSWHETSVPRVLVKAHARAALDLANLIPQITAGGLLDRAEGAWLTLLAASNYDVERTEAVANRRVLRLVNDSGSAVDINEATVVQSDEGLRFRAISAGTIAATAGSTLDLVFEAEETGDAYDVSQTGWELVTAIAGVTATEPVETIVRNGSNEETDDSLRARCREKWATLGAGANVDAYSYWAKNTPGVTETITRVQVKDSHPLPGQVSLYLATDDGAVSTTSDPDAGLAKSPVAAPTITVTGTPSESFTARLEIDGPGGAGTSAARGTATFRLSTDGGASWATEDQLTAATYVIGSSGVTINFPAGTYTVGDVWTWQSIASTVTLVQNYIDPASHLGKAPNCVDVIVNAATEYTLNLTGTITVSSATYKSAVENARATVLAGFVKQVDVGGVIRVAELIERFMGLDGVIDCTFATPAANVTLSDGQVCKAGTVSGITVTT